MIMIGLAAIVGCAILLALINRWYGCFSMIISSTTVLSLIYDIPCYIDLLSIYTVLTC